MVKSLLKKVVDKTKRVIVKNKSQNTVLSLHNKATGNLKLILNALRRTLQDKSFLEEKEWIGKIEALREKLKSSTSEISIIDYGSGSINLDTKNEKSDQNKPKSRIIGEVCQTASKPYIWSFLLFNLIREFKPSVCLELGTCLGISASFQASALKLNQKGKLITLEGSESLAEIAKNNFQLLGLDNIQVEIGMFQNTLDEALIKNKPINYAFIDGHHDEYATEQYFEKIFPFLSEQALVIFDDISWSEGMKRVWRKIEEDEKVKVSIDLGGVGICLIDDKIEEKQNYKLFNYLD